MSFKKYLGLAVVGITSAMATTAMAGGPSMMEAPKVSDSGFYLEAGLGYVRSRWINAQGTVYSFVASSNGSVTGGGSGGFTWGGDVGYQFNRNYSFEVGAWSLRKVTGNLGFAGVGLSAGAVTTSSWLLYAAAKISVPLAENLDLFGKAGLGWRFLNYSGPGIGVARAGGPGLGASLLMSSSQHYVAPLLGAGLQYWFTPEWSLSVQYLYHAAETDLIAAASPMINAPSAHFIVATAAYKFNL